MIDAKKSVDDKLLLAKVAEGSNEAFDLLYDRHWKSVYSAAFKRLQNRDLSLDVTQDVFLQLWVKKDITRIDNLPAYLHVAARNKTLTLMERERRFVPVPDLLQDLGANIDQADADVLQKEFIRAYEDLVNSLTASQQKIFRMRYNEDLSTAEIAQILNISRKTVQNQLAKSLSHIKSSLKTILILCVIYQSTFL